MGRRADNSFEYSSDLAFIFSRIMKRQKIGMDRRFLKQNVIKNLLSQTKQVVQMTCLRVNEGEIVRL